MNIEKIEKMIEHLENKINKQEMIQNERDLNHLDNLQQLYISKLKNNKKKTQNMISCIGYRGEE